MTLEEIRASLAQRRDELQAELRMVDAMLDAATEKKSGDTKKSKPKKKDQSASPAALEAVLRAVRHEPEPTRAIAGRTPYGSSYVSKTLEQLVAEGRIRRAGLAKGRGRIPLYASYESDQAVRRETGGEPFPPLHPVGDHAEA